MTNYFSEMHAKRLAGCVSYLIKEEKERHDMDSLFKKVVSLNQMDGLLSVEGWEAWARTIVLGAKLAVEW